MKILKIFLLPIVVMLIELLFAAPIRPLPGFLISGTPEAARATCRDTAEVDESSLRVP